MAHQNKEILENLANYLTNKVDQKHLEELKQFCRHYYAAVPLEDLEHIVIPDLYGAALSHWNLILHYHHGSEKVRVFNPTLETEGWQSAHTIVEVVIEDMPFLLQSVSNEINRYGLTNHIVIHPVFYISYEQDAPQLFVDAQFAEQKSICLLHLQIDKQTDAHKLKAIQNSITSILHDVRAATQDWKKCLQKMTLIGDTLQQTIGEEHSQQQNADFLHWLCDNHFVFLGYREYTIKQESETHVLHPVAGSGLGVLRDELSAPEDLAQHQPLLKQQEQWQLVISKGTTKATVHRSVFMDYIGIRQFNNDGQLINEKRFLGLYSSTAYLAELNSIPCIRNKVAEVIRRFGFRTGSHQSRSLFFILRSLPRDEIFQASTDELYNCVDAVLQLQNRQRVKVFVRHDVYGQFISLLAYVPRERYTTETRIKIQQILLDYFSAGFMDFSVQLSESILARIHFFIRTDEDCTLGCNTQLLERKIVDVMTDWRDELRVELLSYFGEAKGNQLYDSYHDSFSAAYREEMTTRTAVLDIKCLEQMQSSPINQIETVLYSPLTAASEKSLRFKLFSKGQASLSRSLPMLENMGVKVCDERPYALKKNPLAQNWWLHDFGLILDSDAGEINLETLKPRFEEAFEFCWYGKSENDSFNQLIVRAGINWQQVMIFRCFYLYLRQVGMTFSQQYVEATLAKNPDVVRLLVHLFMQRFDPSLEQSANSDQQLYHTIESTIDQVTSLDEDRILRRFLNLIEAAVRTNFFNDPKDDLGNPYLAVKFDSSSVLDMPSPVPYFEIFVYSPRVEGIHLRGGPVARGGLRWSDRREDFRTEVLGLMKAQMTKNSVIVPTGAKGGFVVKRLNSMETASQRQDEVVACYQIFISGLLDLTDNLINGQLVKPEDVNCYDQDDSYLVVAADKGTARFSDYANQMALDYKFWLGDAFASGGSNGYDHKKMGITARGAWESVKHHFSCMGINCQKTPFTVTGIGGMVGDVFGNGMLLSKQIKLVAAFDHQHIFLDPDPHPETSWKERQRLFQMEGASWNDYTSDLLSKGGGVYSRTVKSIQISPQVKERLNVQIDHVTPNELIRLILCAPVDLLWNGGIGTYVKARDETHLHVGDRANDAVRINGEDLRCRIVAEGGNLGFTQAGRIEYAAKGGRINTDSIDNAAGVDCSDHEVNIKILLNELIEQGDLTAKQRNLLLQEMTDNVATLVLQSNAEQNLVITLATQNSSEEPADIERLIALLEKDADLDRSLEYIPSSEALANRPHNMGLYRPEIAVLLAYCKQMYKQALLKDFTGLDGQLFQHTLHHYFPHQLIEKYPQFIKQHYLAKDITANSLINKMINRMGMTFPYRILAENEHSISTLVEVYGCVTEIFSIDELWQNAVSNQLTIRHDALLNVLANLQRLTDRAVHWFLHLEQQELSEQDVDFYTQGIKQLTRHMPSLISDVTKQQHVVQVEKYRHQGVPAQLAMDIANTDILFLFLDVMWLHKHSKYPLLDCANILFSVFEKLDMLWLREQINTLPKTGLWQSLARRSYRKSFNGASQSLGLSVIEADGTSNDSKLKAWNKRHESEIDRYKLLLDRVKEEPVIDIEKITVLLRALQEITECKHETGMH